MFLDLRRLAQTTGRTTDELLQLYVLDGFLDRLTQSELRDHVVLKGGVLIAAYEARRATRDVDFAAKQIANDIDTMIEAVRASLCRFDIDDGLTYYAESLRAQIICEDDDYSGVRIHRYSRTRHRQTSLPSRHQRRRPDLARTDHGQPSTAPQHRTHPTHRLPSRHGPRREDRHHHATRHRQHTRARLRRHQRPDRHQPTRPNELRTAIQRVAEHRAATIRPLAQTLDGYASIAQPRWTAWRRNQRLESTTPANFSTLLQTVTTYVDTLLI